MKKTTVESVCEVLKPLVDAWLKRASKKEVQKICASLRKPEVCNAIDSLLGVGAADYLKLRLRNKVTGARSKRSDFIFRSRTGVIFGLTKVIPKFYQGWDGECPGCDVDAGLAELILRAAEIPYVKKLDKRAIRDAFKKTFRATFAEDGLSVIFYSGHGGQERDRNGDEEDGLDETLCLADGQFSDDLIYELLCEAPATQTVIFITDCCNSKTNYKAFQQMMRRAKNRTAFKGTLLHVGGCGDGEASIGTTQGGELTLALARNFSWAITFKEWIEKTQKSVKRQKVSYMAEGPRAKAVEAMTLSEILRG